MMHVSYRDLGTKCWPYLEAYHVIATYLYSTVSKRGPSSQDLLLLFELLSLSLSRSVCVYVWTKPTMDSFHFHY